MQSIHGSTWSHNRRTFQQPSEDLDAVQLDSCRLADINKILAVLFMNPKFGVPVIPQSGRAGMVELCSYISTIDYFVVSGKKSVL
ncbi:L-galactonate dehydratase [Penicillium herquei]|nr:L-galactonate dehydratase [Penicillium herquei]